MFKTTLVETDILSGQRVVDELEKLKLLQVTAAFWLYVEEEDEWKLIIASPDVAGQGPINLYTRIATMLNDLSIDPQKPVQMPLTKITLVSPDSLLYERVKQYSRLLETHIYKMPVTS
jgi:hypothetical protein